MASELGLKDETERNRQKKPLQCKSAKLHRYRTWLRITERDVSTALSTMAETGGWTMGLER